MIPWEKRMRARRVSFALIVWTGAFMCIGSVMAQTKGAATQIWRN